MIVTCESCKSKYKLDDGKITGRGAKITCPRCKHVFVVYARAPGEVPQQSIPPTQPWDSPRASAGGAPGLQEAVKRDGWKDSVVPPSGGPVIPSPAPPSPVPGRANPTVAVPLPGRPPDPPTSPAWEDEEPTRIRESVPPPAHEVVRPPDPKGVPLPASPAPAASGPPAPGEIAARAASLDFRKVGVTTWKVKVKIGLIYDFSDIRTLRKYIQDGRVTPADVVSWDGKNWKPIGEIADLDAFFVETWDRLAALKEDTLAPAPSPAPPPKPEEPSGPIKTGGEPDRFQDPFEDMKRKQREKAERRPAPTPAPAATAQSRKPAEPGTDRRALYGLVLFLLVLGSLGLFWWMNQQQPTAETPPSKPATPATSAEDVREAWTKKIDDVTKPAPELPPTPADPVVQPPPSELGTPVRPAGIPEGAVPVAKPRPGAPQPGTQQTDQTAADHAAVGDDAASSGDWATAASAYKKAVALDGRNVTLLSKLGRAQYETKDYGSAQATLEKAAKMGSKDAPKYLGHILREQGDTSGANGWYQQYLKGSPPDRAEIEKLMSGG